jgi:alpha-N-acetylglucosaminidase
MQGWMFQSSAWTDEYAKALLTSVPIGKMLVLDLYAELSPVYPLYKSFYGQPFVFCLLNNFGGRRGMFGDIVDIIDVSN